MRVFGPFQPSALQVPAPHLRHTLHPKAGLEEELKGRPQPVAVTDREPTAQLAEAQQQVLCLSPRTSPSALQHNSPLAVPLGPIAGTIRPVPPVPASAPTS